MQLKKDSVGRGIATTALAALLAIGATTASAQRQPTVEVFKSPSCGCCAKWVTHLQEHGFATRVTNVDDVAPIKAKNKVPARAQSCHTATVDGYVLEGHVPAADVQRLLKERPAILGLAVPGMPVGSPGMEVPNMKPAPFDVMAFDRQGQLQTFSSHNR
jgi:hypothetical protein